jgi:hypothetical protein
MAKRRFSYILILYIVLYVCDSNKLFSQQGLEPSQFKQFNITINFDDYTVKTQMLKENKNIRVNNDCMYMWYGSQKIIETKGGYDGRLIHGTYRAFYLNDQLKEQGQIKYGLRNKEWKYWYPDGKLKEVITWKKGVKNGAYYLYNDYGQLVAKSHFKNDKLHGNFYTYGPTGKITDKKKYKKGDEVHPRAKTEEPKKEKAKSPGKTKKQELTGDAKTEPAKEKNSFLKRLFQRKSKPGEPEKPKKTEKKIITT